MNKPVVVASDMTVVTPNCGHVVPLPAVEVAVPIEHEASFNSYFRHRLAASVRHKNSAIAQGWHDCGRLIDHNLGPLDVIVGYVMSSRQIMFSAGAVQVEGHPVGFATIVFGPGPPTPMLTCGLVPLPVGSAVTSASNTVIVGMHPILDYRACWEGVAIDIWAGTLISVASVLITIFTAGGAVAFDVASELGFFGLDALMDIAGRTLSPGQRWVEYRRGDAPPAAPNSAGSDPSSWPSI